MAKAKRSSVHPASRAAWSSSYSPAHAHRPRQQANPARRLVAQSPYLISRPMAQPYYNTRMANRFLNTADPKPVPRPPTGKGPREAYEAFCERFPDNNWQQVAVAGDELLCGLRAIRASFMEQFPGTRAPEISELKQVYKAPEVQGPNLELGDQMQDNVNDFYVDQLGAIVYHWGTRRGFNLRIGLILGDGTCSFMGTPTDSDPSVTTLWITTTSTNGVTGDDMSLTDHYSGIKPMCQDQGVCVPQFRTPLTFIDPVLRKQSTQLGSVEDKSRDKQHIQLPGSAEDKSSLDKQPVPSPGNIGEKHLDQQTARLPEPTLPIQSDRSSSEEKKESDTHSADEQDSFVRDTLLQKLEGDLGDGIKTQATPNEAGGERTPSQ